MWHLPSLQGYSIVADLMDVSETKRTIDEAVEKMGGLDILVSPPSSTKPSRRSFVLSQHTWQIRGKGLPPH